MEKKVRYYYFTNKYRGERYFAILYLDGFPIYAIQVCLNPGETKRGRSNNFGICRMSYVSVSSNYGFSSDFKFSTKRKFDMARKKVYSMLKNFDTSIIKMGDKKRWYED